ncbi:hypothetical protein [Streptomyces sp. R44]|uniref:Uncharacterized protein n=1 Tax=Streptomyces sp. R44 TaxID=3238633 RepID=A0AB39T561_9ACTN
MTRTEHEADQIVFRWDSENLTGNTGFGPVAWSGPRDDAENLFRVSGPVLRASGDEIRPALIRLRERGYVMLIRRVPFTDADGRTSVLCHALVGAPSLLKPFVCLGLHGWEWEGAAHAAGARGRLPVVPAEALAPGGGLAELDRRLPYVAEELVGAVAEFLRHPEGPFTILDERGDTAPPVLWGLQSIVGAVTRHPWTFATHDTVELPSLQFAFVGRWSGAASRNTERRRVDPRERCGDRAEEIATRLVRHHLAEIEEHGRDHVVARVLGTTASTHRGPLLDTAARAADTLDTLDHRGSAPRGRGRPPRAPRDQRTTGSRDQAGAGSGQQGTHDARDQAGRASRHEGTPDPRHQPGPGSEGVPDPRDRSGAGPRYEDTAGTRDQGAPGSRDQEGSGPRYGDTPGSREWGGSGPRDQGAPGSLDQSGHGPRHGDAPVSREQGGSGLRDRYTPGSRTPASAGRRDERSGPDPRDEDALGSRDQSGADPREQRTPGSRDASGADPRHRSGPDPRRQGAPTPAYPDSPPGGNPEPPGSSYPAAPDARPRPAGRTAPAPDGEPQTPGRPGAPDGGAAAVPAYPAEPPSAPEAPRPAPGAVAYPRPVLPRVRPEWTGPGKGARRGPGRREREAETSLVHKLPNVRSPEEARELVVAAGHRELLDALRKHQAYIVVTVLLEEIARRLPSWEHPLRRELCEVAISRALWAVAPPAARDDRSEPAEEQRAANAAELYRWAVRPLLAGGDAPVGTVAELLSRLRTSPEPSACEAFWLIVDGERPGLPDAVWLSLLKEAYGLPRTPHGPAPAFSPGEDLGSGYTRRFLRRAALLIGGLVAAILLIGVAQWLT